MMSNSKKFAGAVIYRRVSTMKQAQDGISLEVQKDECKKYLNNINCKLIKTFTDVHSAAKTSKGVRKGLKQALTFLDKDMVIIVHSLSRLSRNLVESSDILWKIKERGGLFNFHNGKH